MLCKCVRFEMCTLCDGKLCMCEHYAVCINISLPKLKATRLFDCRCSLDAAHLHSACATALGTELHTHTAHDGAPHTHTRNPHTARTCDACRQSCCCCCCEFTRKVSNSHKSVECKSSVRVISIVTSCS